MADDFALHSAVYRACFQGPAPVGNHYKAHTQNKEWPAKYVHSNAVVFLLFPNQKKSHLCQYLGETVPLKRHLKRHLSTWGSILIGPFLQYEWGFSLV
jgi:hypothetical protein